MHSLRRGFQLNPLSPSGSPYFSPISSPLPTSLWRLIAGADTASLRRASRPATRLSNLRSFRPAMTVSAADSPRHRIEMNSGDGDIDGHGKTNAWLQPGPAAYDFRSDTATSPTTSMLESITHATLLDDVLHADPTTLALEAQLASLLGQEEGVLALSGTMGNQLAIRAHLDGPPHSVLADARSHAMCYEAGGMASLSGAFPLPVPPSRGRQHLVLDDVRRAAHLGDDTHIAPTRLVCLENTLSGSVLPLSVVKEICAWCRARGIKTHLDGARLWEAVAAQVASDPNFPDDFEAGGSSDGSGSNSGDRSFKARLEAGMRAYGREFDSVTVCFSKGLGAPLGSMLAGRRGFAAKARHVRKSIGGGMRQTGVVAAPAAAAVRDTFFGGLLSRSHALADRLASAWLARGGRLLRPTETNMVWLDLRAPAHVDDDANGDGEAERPVPERDASGFPVPGPLAAALGQECDRLGLQIYADDECRIVVHYQICDDAVDKLTLAMDRALAAVVAGSGAPESGEQRHASSAAAASASGFKGYGMVGGGTA